MKSYSEIVFLHFLELKSKDNKKCFQPNCNNMGNIHNRLSFNHFNKNFELFIKKLFCLKVKNLLIVKTKQKNPKHQQLLITLSIAGRL